MSSRPLTPDEVKRAAVLVQALEDIAVVREALLETEPKNGYDRRAALFQVADIEPAGSESSAEVEIDLDTAAVLVDWLESEIRTRLELLDIRLNGETP